MDPRTPQERIAHAEAWIEARLVKAATKINRRRRPVSSVTIVIPRKVDRLYWPIIDAYPSRSVRMIAQRIGLDAAITTQELENGGLRVTITHPPPPRPHGR